MKIAPFAFGTADWPAAEPTEHVSKTGMVIQRTRYFGDEPNRICIRMVEHTPGYLVDHWCKKGRILSCLDGELKTTLGDGRTFTPTPGMSYQVGDDTEAHQSTIKKGARLLIVD